jgi:hypothetical protein
MTSAAQVRAALDALFDAPAPLVPLPPANSPAPPDIPHNLDACIQADAALVWEGVSYRWFAGRDASNVLHIFRCQRGLTLEAWHATLRKQLLTAVQGPYRSQVQAQRGH